MPIRVKDQKIRSGGHKSYEFEVVVEKKDQVPQSAAKSPKS